MIKSIEIRRYRGLKEFHLENLGRVNLLVGKNNLGKTSVLEAIYLLSLAGDPYSLLEMCGRRGGRFLEERDERLRSRPELDVSHLFNGHELTQDNSFEIRAHGDIPNDFVRVDVLPPSGKDKDLLPIESDEEEEIPRPRLALGITTGANKKVVRLSLSRRGGLSYESADIGFRRVGRRDSDPITTVRYVSTESLVGEDLVRLWDKIQLTPFEDLVLRALKFIDPKIERVGAIGSARFFGSRGGFLVKRQDFPQPFPLGSLGDGAWRMFAMAIVLTQCRNGVLLVDEIDTGLHYTVMTEMWKLIHSVSNEYNVQVFATTHSYDCVYSLSEICDPSHDMNSRVTIQRIEAEKTRSVPFSEAEIAAAARRGIEIR